MAIRQIESATHRGSRLEWYEDTDTAKRFYVLTETGSFVENCAAHGRLLAREVERGVFPEILDTIAVDTTKESEAATIALRALFFDIAQDVFTATSGEFQDGVKALSDGYRAGHAGARYDLRDVIQACVAIDVGNVATGFARRASRLLGEDGSPVAIIKELKAALRHYASVNPDDLDQTPPRTVLGLLMRAIGRSPGMGCTGFSIAPALCGGTHGLHARTFDGAFFDWNNVPGLHLVDERDPARPAILHRYAAVGTAGLVYPGGISGINEAGLAFSLHQMSTVSYTRGTPGGGWEIAPFVMQRMLRECTTLGEAIALAESVRHFASWTILASDARNGQSVRIEINGHGGARAPKPEVSAIDIAPWLAQSNHFLAASMRERFDFFGDAHFTKTPGKWLETRARKRTVEQELTPILANGSLDMTKALALLASHDDAALDGAFRSFGRTIVKAYGIMASIARAPAAGGTAELWFTLGDRLPGPHSAMVGFAVDWDHFALTPLAGGTLRAATPPDQLDALSAYIDAHRAQLRPRGEDGRYLGREPTAAEEKAIAATVLGHLDRAIEKAENTHGEVEAPMRYIRARVAFEADDLTRARRDIERLRALATGNVSRHTLIAYERALILTLCAALEKAEGHDDKAKADATTAAAEMARAKAAMPDGGSQHSGFGPWTTAIADIERLSGRRKIDLPTIDFVTIE